MSASPVASTGPPEELLAFDLAAGVGVPDPDVLAERGRLVDRLGPIGRVSVGARRADVQEPPDPGLRRRLGQVLGCVDAIDLKLGPASPVAHLRRRVVDHLDAAYRPPAGLGIGEVPPDELDPESTPGTLCRWPAAPGPERGGRMQSSARRCDCPASPSRPLPDRAPIPSLHPSSWSQSVLSGVVPFPKTLTLTWPSGKKTGPRRASRRVGWRRGRGSHGPSGEKTAGTSRTWRSR